MTREEAIDILKHDISADKQGIEYCHDELGIEALDMAIKALEQEPKTGHWITQWNVAHQKEYYYCSECREEFSYDGETGIKMNDYKYCPNCGCRMVEPQESDEQEEVDDWRDRLDELEREEYYESKYGKE